MDLIAPSCKKHTSTSRIAFISNWSYDILNGNHETGINFSTPKPAGTVQTGHRCLAVRNMREIGRHADNDKLR